jgi:hypothetical protein
MSASYSYANSKWRGQNVIPYASNIQWDVFQNTKGKLLVRMLYLERETHFKKDCEKARHSKDSFYYDFKALKDCYKRD